jgi:glycosyltransferase involved in cell wall biosynthesis
MRVLVVHDEPVEGGYGAEAYVRRLIAGLRDAGDEVAVFAGEVRHTGARRLRDVWDPAARDLITEHAAEFDPDVIHFHNIARELSASVLGAAPQVPAVMTVHDFRLLGAFEHSLLGARGYVERGVARQVRRAAIKRLAATIGVSDQVSDGLRAAGFPNVSTVRVPVEAPANAPRPVTECRDVAVVARLAKDKGVDVAIAAFDAATDEQPDGRRIRIAGDGPERAKLERRIAGRPSPERFELLGRLDEAAVSALLGDVRAVVVASQPQHRPEGSSLAMVEAAMHGRPVVASNDPAVKEVAATLGNALVTTGWSVDEFTRELERLFADDDLARQLGQRGKANAERLHSVAAVTAATQDVYRQAVAGAVR